MKKVLLSFVALLATVSSFAQVTLADLAGTYSGTGHKYGDDNVEASFTLTYADEALSLTSVTFGSLTISNLSVACTLENGVLSIGSYSDDSWDYTSIDACKAEVIDKDNLKFIGDGDNALGLYYMSMDTFDEYSYWFNVGDAVSKGSATAAVTLADLAGTYSGTGHKYGDDNVEGSFTLTYADDALSLTSVTFGSLTISNLSVACTLENGVLSIGSYSDDSWDYTSIDACKAEVIDKDNLKFIGDGDNALGLYYMNMDTFDEYSYWFNVGDAVSKGSATAAVTLADLAGTYSGIGHKYGDDNVEGSFTLTYADEALSLTSVTFGSLTISNLSVACTLENGVLSIGSYSDDSWDYTSIDACKAEVIDKDNLKFIGDGDNALGLYYMSMDTFDEYSYWFNVGDAVSKGSATAINSINFSKEGNSQKYNITGQPVGNGYKGIVIMNGRKYINK